MVVFILLVLGLIFGSFISALVWRVHEQSQKTTKGKSAKSKQNKDLSIVKGRSMCPSCHHVLVAKDLVPLFSWLSLKGKCRYCKKDISPLYPIIEAVTAILFIGSYIYWPLGFKALGITEFVFWLILLVGFIAIAIYDIRWFLIPNRIVYSLLAIVLLDALITVIYSHDPIRQIAGVFWGALIGGGIFYLLFQVSKGKWIGGGDIRLGLVIGILLGGPLMSILMLFFASCLGTIYSLPFLARGKLKTSARIPFGPFLIMAAVLVQLFGTSIIAWYRGLLI